MPYNENEDGKEAGHESGLREGREEVLHVLIATYLEQHMPLDEIKIKLQDNFKLNEEEVQRYIDKHLVVTH